MKNFTSVFIALQREAYLAHACIAAGLTELRTANVGDTQGKFYTGLFQLSIGFERAAKLALVLNHMSKHRVSPPAVKKISSYSHDLGLLYSETQRVARESGAIDLAGLTPRQEIILAILSDFATETRYANLERISGKLTPDPLEQWNEVLIAMWSSEVSARTKARLLSEAAWLDEVLGGHSVVRGVDLDGSEFTLTTWTSRPRVLEEASRFAVWEVVEVVRQVTRVVEQQSDSASAVDAARGGPASIPYMRDFFRFLEVDRAVGIRKKKWP